MKKTDGGDLLVVSLYVDDLLVTGSNDELVELFKAEMRLQGFVDSDWAGSSDDMRSTSGSFFTLGAGVFSWNSKKEDTLAQSRAEAEYIAAAAAVNQAIWLKKLMTDLSLAPARQKAIFIEYVSWGSFPYLTASLSRKTRKKDLSKIIPFDSAAILFSSWIA